MGPGDIAISGDRLQKLLLSTKVHLIKIPPPGQSDLVDISRWDLNDYVWSGMMRFVEEERLDGIDDMDGVIELHNCNGDIFALIRYTGETVQLTQSQRAFKVIIDHNGDKYALGLVFEDKDTGREFSAALTTFKKDWLTMHETQMEQMEDLKEHVDKLSIHSEDDDFGDFVAG